ncbi:MAG: hypothetical protein Q9201_001694 [Fulgogasparrea decipioides]
MTGAEPSNRPQEASDDDFSLFLDHEKPWSERLKELEDDPHPSSDDEKPLASQADKNESETEEPELARELKEAQEREERLESLRKDIADMNSWRQRHDARCLPDFKANLMESFIKALSIRTGKHPTKFDGGSLDDDGCTTLAFRKILLSNDSEIRTAFETHFPPGIDGAEKVFNAIDNMAYDSDSGFAWLLTDKLFLKGPHKHETELLRPVFGYIYRDAGGQPIPLEEIARMDGETLRSFFPQSKDGVGKLV